MSAEAVEVAEVVALRRGEAARLLGLASQAMQAANSAAAGRMTGDAAERLWQAALGILAIVGPAQERPANVFDLDQERRRRR